MSTETVRRLFATFLLVLAASVGCTGDVDSGESYGFGICGDDRPTCVRSCGSDMLLVPTCEEGQWQCPDDAFDEASCEPVDEECRTVKPTCLAYCESPDERDAECVGGEWTCPGDSVEVNSCPDDTCWGTRPDCVPTCVEPESSEPAQCKDGDHWVCPEGLMRDDQCPSPGCEVTSTSSIPGVTIEFLGDRCFFFLYEAQRGTELRYRVIVDEPVEYNPFVPTSRFCEREPDFHVSGTVQGNDMSYCRCDVGLCPTPEPAWITLEPGIHHETFEWAGYDWNGPSDTGEEYGEPFPQGSYTATLRAVGQVRRADGTVEDVEATSTIALELWPGD